MKRAVLLAILLAGCGGPPDDEPVRAELAVFGTTVEITIRDAAPERAERVIGEISRTFQRMHRQWHPWEPGALMDVNRAIRDGRSSEPPESIVALIEQAQELERQSEGLFNPAIGGLLEAWGFHASERPGGPPPDAGVIAAWVERAPSMHDLEVDGGIVESRNRWVRLDFSAHAKGRAVDVAIDMLREAGIEHAIVNAGGDLRAIGHRGERPWRAAVRHPDGEGGRILATIDVGDGEAVFTSGNYERYREDEGLRYGHILNPKTGMPVDHIASVTVIHHNGAVADAAATALAVAGPDGWQGIAKNMGIDEAMLVDKEGGIHLLEGSRERFRFSN